MDPSWEDLDRIEKSFVGLLELRNHAPIFDRGTVRDFYEFMMDTRVVLKKQRDSSDSDQYAEDY